MSSAPPLPPRTGSTSCSLRIPSFASRTSSSPPKILTPFHPLLFLAAVQLNFYPLFYFLVPVILTSSVRTISEFNHTTVTPESPESAAAVSAPPATARPSVTRREEISATAKSVGESSAKTASSATPEAHQSEDRKFAGTARNSCSSGGNNCKQLRDKERKGSAGERRTMPLVRGKGDKEKNEFDCEYHAIPHLACNSFTEQKK